MGGGSGMGEGGRSKAIEGKRRGKEKEWRMSVSTVPI